MARVILTIILTVFSFVLFSCVSMHSLGNGNVIEYDQGRVFMSSIEKKTVRIVVFCLATSVESAENRLTFSSRGTGVIISSGKSGSYILTADHVVKHDGYACIPTVYRSSDRFDKSPAIAKILGSTKADDIALLQVVVDYKINTGIASNAYKGQKLVVAGFPGIEVYAEGTDSRYQSVSINSGEYATEIYDKDNVLYVFRMTSDVWFGYSGGAVFDINGKVVGVTSFMVAIPVAVGKNVFMTSRPGFYFARPFNRVRKFIKDSGYENLLNA